MGPTCSMAKAADTGRVILRGSVAWIMAVCTFVASAQSILHRRVTIDAEQVRLSTALTLLAKEGGFRLSYNAATLPGDSLVTVRSVEERVDQLLKDLLPADVRWKESGNHIIITGAKGRKQRFTTTGRVLDATTGAAVERAAMYEVRRNNAAVSDAQGAFLMEVTGELERTPILISRHGYHDTVLYVPRNGAMGRITLRPKDHLDRLEPRCDLDRCGVDDLGVARLLVPSIQMEQAASLVFTERRDWQLSLVPTIGTNGAISGSVINRASLNIIGGYARGLEGVEVGGAVNLLRNDMLGLQIAGMGNLVGGRTNGVQVAGGVNHSMGAVEGLQLAGLSNTVWDTLGGVQIAGGVNVVKRGMAGTQVSGMANVTLGDLDGVQVSGGLNVALGAVNKAQVAGAMNYAGSVNGGQVSGGCNVALGEVGGGQVGAAANYARSVTGGQVSFGANVATDSVTGGQVGFGANYARDVSGGQFTFGINVVPGTASGGQVGVVNFARRSFGAQVGIINLSDTVTGVAIGLLTISRTGYHRFDIATGDVLPLGLHLRTGIRGFHNIVGFSPPLDNDRRWGFLYGFGSTPRLGKRGQLDITLTAEQVMEQGEWVDALNFVGRSTLAYGLVLADRFSLAAGPSLNLLVTDHRDMDSGAYMSKLLPENNLMDQVSGTTRLGLWMGWNLSLGVRF